MFSMFIVKLFLNKNIWRVIYMEPQNKFNVKETATYGNECLLQQSLILFIYDSIALLSCWVYLSSFSRTLLIRKSNSLKRKTKTQRKKNNNKQKNKQTKQNERKHPRNKISKQNEKPAPMCEFLSFANNPRCYRKS